MLKLPNEEQIVNQLLKETEQTSPPVDLERIISLWSELSLAFDEIKHEGYLINLGSFGKEIVIRSSAPVSRQRFTIAHEIGHLVLEEHDVKINNCISFRGKEFENNFIEKWCDKFAASLLMPEKWILQDIRQGRIQGLIQSILELPNVYNVSKAAFRKRITEITPLSIFDVKQTNRTLIVERIIEKKYESQKVKKIDVKKTLEDLLPNLENSIEPVKFFHNKTRMLSVYSLIPNDSNINHWAVCIFPQSSKTRRSFK